MNKHFINYTRNFKKSNDMKYVFIVLPLLTFNRYIDGGKEITIGWLTKTLTIRF
jgi:hypothetical protein